MGAKEPINRARKADGDETLDERWVLGEVDKVVDIKANGERCSGNVRGGVGRIDDSASEHAWVGHILLEADALEDCRDLVVPVVSRTTSETV